MKKTTCYKPNPYIGFDDRLLLLVGIPSATVFASLVFSRLPAKEFFDDFGHFFVNGVAFTTGYWLFNRFLMIFLRKRFQRLDETPKRLIIQFVVDVSVYPLLGFSIHMFLHAMYWVCGFEHPADKESLAGLLATYVLTFTIVAIYEAIFFFKQYKASIQDRERLKTEHVNSQLVSLRNQINPHFLFNSLNTLMSLIPAQASPAHDYLGKLASFYRYTVSEHAELKVPLHKELEMLHLYLDLIKVRFGEGLQVVVDIEAEPDEYTLPMTLQLLAENAVKHNIVSKEAPLQITLNRQGDYMTMSNTIQLRISETGSTGMGLKNIQERFSYEGDKLVEIEKNDKFFKVSIPILQAT